MTRIHKFHCISHVFLAAEPALKDSTRKLDEIRAEQKKASVEADQHECLKRYRYTACLFREATPLSSALALNNAVILPHVTALALPSRLRRTCYSNWPADPMHLPNT